MRAAVPRKVCSAAPDQVEVPGGRRPRWSVHAVLAIPLGRGLLALVDDEERFAALAELGWYASKAGNCYYAQRGVRSADGSESKERLHRVIMEITIGRDLLPGELVDHVNRVTTDCRTENLRLADKSQNSCNVARRRDNTSGFRGVGWHAGKFVAVIRKDGKAFNLGRFVLAEDAARAYDVAAVRLHGEFAMLNFPRDLG